MAGRMAGRGVGRGCRNDGCIADADVCQANVVWALEGLATYAPFRFEEKGLHLV